MVFQDNFEVHHSGKDVHLFDDSLDPNAKPGILDKLNPNRDAEKNLSLGEFTKNECKEMTQQNSTRYFVNPRFAMAYSSALNSVAAPSFTSMLVWNERALTVGTRSFLEVKLDSHEFYQKGNVKIAEIVGMSTDKESYIAGLQTWIRQMR